MKQAVILNKILMVLFFCILSVVGFAQTPLPDDPGLIPVDGGLAFLLAAGVGYGAKKAYEFKKSIRQKSLEKE